MTDPISALSHDRAEQLPAGTGLHDIAAQSLLANRPAYYLGGISFGLYLWHMPLVFAIAPRLPEAWSPAMKFWALLGLVLPASLVIAELSHRFVKQPFLRRKPAHRT